ncbi:MAG TPA: HAMP domain-containing sensor histidine kinase, partial [Turneriella sp.]|nr:HAMP domain-containing sensor histidine kinase [Turneriella sp.]
RVTENNEVSRSDAGVKEKDVGSSVQDGGILLKKSAVPASRLAEIAFKPFAAQFAERNISVSLNLPHTLPYLVCDIAKVAWVLSIFLSNAVRYTPEWGKLNVSASLLNAKLRIAVENSGYGISIESAERMFTRVENESAIEFGQGLALILAREIIEAHGGLIGVESELGVMTRFYFEIPIENTTLRT